MRIKRFLVHTVLILAMLTGFSLSAHATPPEHIAGFGLGLPYGGMGFNYEAGINDYISPTIGLGYLPDNFGWNAGVRLCYPDRENNIRGRITLLYGTNTLLKKVGPSGSDYKTDTGFSAGIGFDWWVGKRWGIAGDLFFADTDTPAGYKEEGNDIFLALGVNYRW